MSNQRKFGYEAFEKWEVSLVKKKARKLIGKFGITESNVEDLEQELFLHIFLKKKGGSSKAQVRHQGKSVMAQILDNRVRDIIEKAQTKKREGDLKSDSLHRELGQSEEGDSMTYEDVLSEDKALWRIGRKRLVDEQETRHALHSTLGKLSPFQRKVCRLLLKHQKISNVAKALGMKRPTLYLEIERIREIFDEEGLGEYI